MFEPKDIELSVAETLLDLWFNRRQVIIPLGKRSEALRAICVRYRLYRKFSLRLFVDEAQKAALKVANS